MRQMFCARRTFPLLFASVLQNYLELKSHKWLLGYNQWRTHEFCSGGGSTNSVRTDDRENGGLGAVVP